MTLLTKDCITDGDGKIDQEAQLNKNFTTFEIHRSKQILNNLPQ